MALGALRRSRAAASASEAPDAGSVPSTPPAAAPSDAPVGPTSVSLDDVVVAWAAILGTLSPATRSSVQEAQPVALHGDVLTFAVPPEIIDAAKPRFKKAAGDIRAALAERLGVSFKFLLEPGDGLAARASSPRSDIPLPPEPPEDTVALDEIESIDTSELVDATDIDVKPSAVSKLESQFGATVVDERPRE